MSFRRVFQPQLVLRGEALTSALIGIGVRLGGDFPSLSPNIEDTLYFAVTEAVEVPDYRVLALVTDWLTIHADVVNVDRLTRLVGGSRSLVRSYWAATGQRLSRDTRWKKMARYAPRKKLDLFGEGTDFLITKNGGEDERFVGTCLRVPQGTLRHRPTDIFSSEEIAARHSTYYYRLVMGPSYRADMWALLERDPTASAADVARFAYGCFTSAWEVKKDFERIAKARRLAARVA